MTTKGELDQAENLFEQALRIDPKNAEYHSGYAYLLDQLGRKDQAASECETAYSSGAKAQCKRTMAMARSWKNTDSQTRRSRNIDRLCSWILPTSMPTSIWVVCFWKKTSLTEAREHFEKASELKPETGPTAQLSWKGPHA